MPSNLADAAVLPTPANTVFVADLPLAEQADATLEPTQRWRAGLDVAALKIRFYRCDLRKSDQANLNCSAAADGSLALVTQGDIRLMRVTSGYPAVLQDKLAQQRFWAEHAGTVVRGVTDLPRTRYDQRLNGVVWDARRGALGIPAHSEPSAPVSKGPFSSLRNFSFTDVNNYSWRVYSGDDSVVDGNGDSLAVETRKNVSGGVDQRFVRNRSYWTGSEWFDCPNSGPVNSINAAAPYRWVYCKGYVEELALSVKLSLAGRFMREVINDIHAYRPTDGSAYSSWGPQLTAHPQLADTRFPTGASMEYRGLKPIANPEAIATAATDQVRVAPSATSGVAFDAVVNKARFTRSNCLASNGQSTNYSTQLDTVYTIKTVGGVRLLKFTAMPEIFETRVRYARRFAERNGGVWHAFKDKLATETQWSVRLDGSAASALHTALGIQ